MDIRVITEHTPRTIPSSASAALRRFAVNEYTEVRIMSSGDIRTLDLRLSIPAIAVMTGDAPGTTDSAFGTG